MRNLFIAGVAGIVFASTSVALAQQTRWVWTEKRAEQIVTRDATVQLRGPERAELQNELLAAVRLYGGLAFAASDVGDSNAALTFSTLEYRFREALEAVRSGLAINAADCRGSGKAAKGRRFSNFDCSVTSDVLEIPSVELVYSQGAQLPTAIEGPTRVLGPWQARLDVHVTGRSAMRYAQAE